MRLGLYIPIAVYTVMLAYIWYTVVAGRAATTADTYAKGTGSYRLKILFMTMVATMIGPTYSMGVVDQARSYGFFYTLFFLAAMLQLLLAGLFFGEKLREEAEGIATVGELIGRYYGRVAQAFTGLATIAQSLAFTGVLCLGAAKVLEAVWGLPIAYGVVATSLFVGGYSISGGLPAVIETDRLQFWFLCGVGVVAALSAAGLFLTGGPIDPLHWWNPNPTEFPIAKIVTIAIGFFLGEAFIPIYAVRSFIAVDARTAKYSFILCSVFGAVWFISLSFFGIVSHLLPSTFDPYGITLFNLVAYVSANPFLSDLSVGIATAGILGIVMSTMDSVLHAGSISFTHDLLMPFVKLRDAEQLSYDKSAMLMIAIFGSALAFTSSNLVDILFLGYSVWVPTLVVPLTYALWRSPPKSPRAAIGGISAGIFGYMAASAFGGELTSPLLVGLLANAVIFWLLIRWAPTRPLESVPRVAGPQ